MTSPYHSIIGLSKSGKTTFLAALWHLISAGEVSTRLVLDKLVGDHQYLNTIVAAWRRCEEVPHTSLSFDAEISIHVHERSTDTRAVLRFPDLSGESFHRQVTTRSCRTSYVEGFAGVGGLLLFVTANRGQDGLTLLDLAPALQGSHDLEHPGNPREWSPDLIPEQVRLVELLQFLQQRPFRRSRRRLAVVVSAWDIVLEPRPFPEQWLARELPLLHQLLSSNPSSFEVRVYGVSAQGGDVTGDARLALLSKTPSERIMCVGPEAHAHDLTAPIVWLMARG